MLTFLKILGIVVLLIIILVRYSMYARRPKRFKGKLKPLERKLYAELEANLPAAVGHLVPKQLAYLKRGVRLYFSKSYSLELYEEKDARIPADMLFARKDEFKLGTISFLHGITKFKAEFNTYNGRIWGMTVRPNPKYLFGMTTINVEKFKLHNDPSVALDLKVSVEFYDESVSFEGVLGQLVKDYEVYKVQKPLPENQQQLFKKLSETKLPEDYLELLKQTNGLIMEDCVVFGFGALQPVALEDDNYLILAEKSTGCLAIKQSKRVIKLKVYSYEDESDVIDLGADFLKALEVFLDPDR